MNPAYDAVLAAGTETRRDLFNQTALRLGTTAQNAEKDFWVCWTLDALFNGLPAGGPRLLFKGGTSLSKAFGLISRFSEDIDVTVYRQDIGEPASIAALAAMSGKARSRQLDAIRDACRDYIRGTLREQLDAILARTLDAAGISRTSGSIGIDDDDRDGQTLLVHYPAVTPPSPYVRAAVKIESGAKSALDPNSARLLVPYVDADLPRFDLGVANVVTVDATRTFWDKVVILHGLRRWYDLRGELRGDGQRISRHYYDIHRLLDDQVGREAIADRALGADCVAHARMFFSRPDYDLASAEPGRFALVPDDAMWERLRADYGAMKDMIFGDAPRFEDVMDSVQRLEAELNG